jgi:phosphatidate cytidylyltransferase
MTNWALRALSGWALVSIFFLPLILSPGLSFLVRLILLWTMAFGIDHEWGTMTQHQHPFIGLAITIAPVISLAFLSWNIVVAYFCLLWSVDTFAFIGGKILQGPKLAPKVSPNKTWAGLICGAAGCCIVLHILLKSAHFSYCLLTFVAIFIGGGRIHLNNTNFCLPLIGSFTLPITEVLLGIVFALLAQAGDLFVSFYKRKFNVKDTGNFIPGHGGILDRFDGIIFTAPATFIFLILYFHLHSTID